MPSSCSPSTDTLEEAWEVVAVAFFTGPARGDLCTSHLAKPEAVCPAVAAPVSEDKIPPQEDSGELLVHSAPAEQFPRSPHDNSSLSFAMYVTP